MFVTTFVLVVVVGCVVCLVFWLVIVGNDVCVWVGVVWFGGVVY